MKAALDLTPVVTGVMCFNKSSGGNSPLSEMLQNDRTCCLHVFTVNNLLFPSCREQTQPDFVVRTWSDYFLAGHSKRNW